MIPTEIKSQIDAQGTELPRHPSDVHSKHLFSIMSIKIFYYKVTLSVSVINKYFEGNEFQLKFSIDSLLI